MKRDEHMGRQKTDTSAKSGTKRGEKNIVKPAHQKDRQSKFHDSYLADDENFASFNNQLAVMNLSLREIPGDGNCLFRALGDQLEGHTRNHLVHRQNVVDYMKNHRQDFEPFVEDDVPFDKHLSNLSESGTHAGNDAIVAFARFHEVVVVIHQLNSPLWQIRGTEKKGAPEIHISYHNGEHYSSVRRIGDDSESPANIRLSEPQDMSSQKNRKPKDYKNGQRPLTESESSTTSTSTHQDSSDSVDLTDLELQVVQSTGCQDLQLVRSTLEDNLYDIDATVDCIMNLLALSTRQTEEHVPDKCLWGPDGTGTRIFGEELLTSLESRTPSKSQFVESGVKPKLQQPRTSPRQKLQVSNKQRQELKRKERKQASQDKKRNKNSRVELDDNDNEMETVVVKDLGRLNL
ncbi:OTU domain-containing protein 3-like isoform X2 [Tachypleus tridentatus]|uniref:OTU domain-containing protein 3-like isoform X2 n=1 Tax=Tachypleus tridentatus TaxID=6853 RepID=UPI003FD0436F